VKTLKHILLIEDFEEIRQWLAGLLRDTFGEVTITEVATVAQAYAQLDAQTFDLYVIDLNLPDGTGVDILQRIKAQGLAGLCVVATAYDDDAHLLTALNAGADGYLLKDQSSTQLIHDLQGILTGSPPLSPPIARRIMKLAKQESVTVVSTPLSVREEEVLTHIAKCMNRTEIAKQLGVSIHTITSQVRSIYTKLNISSRAEAAIEAVRRGLIST
jgi:DNA-binding NarL/FixJ family response regulator